MRTLGLAAVLGLAGLLNLVGLDREGFGNQYYAAAVWSMLQNWHNFFFVSFDPGGFVSVDKPPFGFWVQVASARLLGFSGLSILLPQALAGVAGVAVLYHLVRRAFGSGAGLLAGLMLALTPVSVSTARNNTIDTLLVLEVLLAAWATVRAAESGRLGWLLLAAALVGLGFETKMLEAYLVVPALGLVYLLAAPRRRLVRLGHLILAGAVLLSVSFAWPMAVDLTPASQRPWVDSTQTDSAVDLALGYNGIQRLLGRGASLQGVQAAVQAARGTGGTGGYAPAARGASGETGGYASGGRVGTGGNGGFGSGGPGATGGNSGFGFGGPGGAGENGPASPLRLLNPQLGGQASWLLPLAILGLLMTGRLAWTRRRGLSRTRRGQAAILWGTWLLTTGAFFSVAQYFHRYYLVMLAPSVAALAAIGLWAGWRAWRSARGRVLPRLLLPLGLLATVAVQAHIVGEATGAADPLTTTALGAATVAALLLLAAAVLGRWRPETAPAASQDPSGTPAQQVGHRAGGPRWLAASVAAGLGCLALLVSPGVWAALPATTGQAGGRLPAAGIGARGGAFALGGPGGGFGAPAGLGLGGANGTGGRGPAAGDGGGPVARRGGFGDAFGAGRGAAAGQSPLLAYLQANQGSDTFLLATPSANQAAPIILATHQPVMALGGFLGTDPILNVGQLQARIESGQVRFFLLGFGPRGGGALNGWVQSTCAQVPPDAVGGQAQVFDCGAVQAAAHAGQ